MRRWVVGLINSHLSAPFMWLYVENKPARQVQKATACVLSMTFITVVS